jgi:cytochrome b involved in lipid metabolism
MRRFYRSATVIFWLLVTVFWGSSVWLAPEEESAVLATGQPIPAAELASHAFPEDCWMAIRGGVYDLTAYLPEHPSGPDLLQPWCGKEATLAYDTKTKGRPHSAYADELLAKYRIGTFAAPNP